MDEINLKKFNEFYNSSYKNKVDDYYNSFYKNKKNFITYRIIVFIITCIIIPLIVYTSEITVYLGNNFLFLLSIYELISIALNIFFSYEYVKKEISKINFSIEKDFIYYIADSSKERTLIDSKQMLSYKSLKENELFNLKKLRYKGKNYISSYYKGNYMVFSDIEMYYYESIKKYKKIYRNGRSYLRSVYSKKKTDVFNGIFIGATSNKKNTSNIYLVPRILNDSYNYIDFMKEEIKLENIKISKKYRVFCEDEIQSRKILTLRFMERINELDRLFPQKKYIVFRKDKRISIFIDDIKLSDINKITLPIFRNELKEKKALKKMYIFTNNLYAIHDVLGLGKGRNDNK